VAAARSSHEHRRDLGGAWLRDWRVPLRGRGVDLLVDLAKKLSSRAKSIAESGSLDRCVKPRS